ncbi:hypothetical protein KQX54_012321 [Cotesia glomerata]|uniref:BEN domain-containing protein n=1 Tax=Cotesia glomerata TaxID=32391 RepID=A0AAV7IWB6_COTGL|nr:hypothetical protein KQX54_012321 [Cotesia glomerata]
MPPTKQKMQEFTYALIWFISTRERFVVKTSKLPKTRRKKGNVVKIIWDDPSTLISQRFDVKILELGKKPVIKIGPQLNNSEQSNLTEIDLLQSNQSSVNNSKNDQSSLIETDEPYHINHNNILSSTSGVQKFVKNQEQVNNESKKVTEDIEVLVSDTEDMGALHTFLPVTAYQYQNTKMSKKEISPNCHIYFPIKLIESIEQSAVTETGVIDWKKILKLALMEIYGNSIANYSAIGRNKNSRPPIDHDIYEGIFQWILLKSKEKISKHDDTNEITSLIANKRVAKLSNNKSREIISELELQFFQKVISAVEKEDKWHHNSDNHLSLMNSESRNSFLIPGATKARISEEHNIFFPKSAIAYIEKRTEKSGNSNLSDWKNLVREALIQIHGRNVGNFCAKGNVTSRTPINSQLLDALYTSKTTITTGTSVQKCSLNPLSPGSKQLYPPKIGSMNRDSRAASNQDSDSTPSTASPLIFNQHDSSSIQQVNPDPRYDHDFGLRPTQSSTDSLLMPRQYDSSNVQQCYPYSSYSSASYQDQHFNYEYQ